MTRFPMPLAFCLAAASLLASFASPAAAQGDVRAMEQWLKPKTIFYRVEGVYAARRAVAYQDNGAMADVRDRVAMDLEWSLRDGQLVKVLRVENFPATLANTANGEPKCQPPVVKGTLEQQVLEVTAGYSSDVMLNVETRWPDVEVVQFCSGKRKLVSNRKKAEPVSLPVLSPVLFGMPASPNVAVSADRRSLVAKQGDWTWTFTPSTTRPK